MDTIISKFLAVSRCSLFIYVTHLVKRAQVLNADLVFPSPPVVVMPRVTRIYASEYSQRFGLIISVSNLIVESFSFHSPYCPLFRSLIIYHFLVANLEDSLTEPFHKFTTF